MIEIESTRYSWFQEQICSTADNERLCRYCLEIYIETRNPIWAYEALHFWCLPQLKLEPEFFPLPRELMFFLFQTTAEIRGLVTGRKPLEYRDGKPLERQESREIKPSEACDFLPEALRLRGYKWNAFADNKKDETAIHFRSIKRDARKNGESEREAMELVMREAKISDERTARRKLNGGRGPRQKSPYPVPKWLHEISDEKAEAPPVPDPKKAKAGKKEKKAGAKKP
ncbi:MAG: hypothetical protein INF84_18430 [Roseomonas sp.]|nr:hypothetical protein [Roseomonas sp.]